MIKKLDRHGDELALVIDREILDQLQIDENTALEVSRVGKTLVITPFRDEQRRRRFEQALESTNQRYANALRRLAE